MAGKMSAGLLLYRKVRGHLEVFLAHPGGPFWKNKDLGVWSIPKGEFSAEEGAFNAALREFEEETGFRIAGDFQPLEPARQSSGKVVHAWAVQGDCDASAVKSNTFSMEWPPKSGKRQKFPEIDRADWFDIASARKKIVKGQIPLIEQVVRKVGGRRGGSGPGSRAPNQS